MSQDWLLVSADELAALAAIRGSIARQISEAYPRFVKQVFPDAA